MTTSATEGATLAVENLKTHFFTRAGVIKAVDGDSGLTVALDSGDAIGGGF